MKAPSIDYAVGLPCTSHGPVGTKLGVFEHTLPARISMEVFKLISSITLQRFASAKAIKYLCIKRKPYEGFSITDIQYSH